MNMNINTNWHGPYNHVVVSPLGHPHIREYQLRTAAGVLIPNHNLYVVYVILNPAGRPLYVGRADNPRDRFISRLRAFREYAQITAVGAPLAGY